MIRSLLLLLWAAILKGVIAAPIMANMIMLAVKPAVMGEVVVGSKLRVLGMLATAVMAGATMIALM